MSSPALSKQTQPKPLETTSPKKLSEASLSQYPEQVRIPHYDRKAVTNGIVHIGVGGFHRAHQALYIENYLEQHPGSDWGICGVGLLKYDAKMRDALRSQDCLYTLVERSAEKDTARIIGSITDYLFAPEKPQAVIDTLADPQCRIVTLTITEGGYYVIEGSGELDLDNSTIQHDLQNPEQPIGIYGYLAEALNQRRQNGHLPFTTLSCDNIQGNGNLVGKMLTAFAKLQNPALGEWIATQATFPNSMVDRITPATTPADLQMVADQFSIDDAWPVVAEPFCQWVVEDRFCSGRPQWESVGVQMTDDVHPYEMMKIRLLNASHLLIGYLGSLLGYTHVHEAMADSLISQAVEGLIDEVIPTLPPLPGIDIAEYRRTLIERFSNPKVRDQLSRLCLNSSDKLPKYLFGSLRDKLQQNGSIDFMSFTVAAWFRYLQGEDDRGNPLPIEDLMAETLIKWGQSEDKHPDQLLSMKALFGDLSESQRFAQSVRDHWEKLYALGTSQLLGELH